jgi:transposase
MSIADIASIKTIHYVESAVSAVDWQEAYNAARQQIVALERRIAQLEAELSEKSILCNEFSQQIDALKYQLVWMAQQIFGRKSEASKTDGNSADNAGDESSNDVPVDDEQQDDPTPDSNQQKRRGKQKGAKGYGRRLRKNLPFEEVFHDIEETDKCCPQCGLPFESLPFTEDSERIHWEVKVVRHIHRRRCYTPTCTCQAVPGICHCTTGCQTNSQGDVHRGLLGSADTGEIPFSKTTVPHSPGIGPGGIGRLTGNPDRRLEQNQRSCRAAL